ncbi:MAG: DMT family transporter [Arenicellales bacterium]
MSDHLKGLLITFAGVMVLSPDTLLIRWLEMDQWALLVYRGVLMALGMALLTRMFDAAPIKQQFMQTGKPGLLSAVCFTISTIAFVTAVHYTTIAHTLVIVATSPLFAAFFSRVFLGERMKLHTLLAIVFVLLGMVFVVGQKSAGSHWVGNVSALVSAMSIAATFVINRKNKHINMVPAISLSGVFTALVAAPFAVWQPLDSHIIILLLLMGLVLTIAFTLITLGPRYIPAAEVSLILPLETVGGTALAWWFLSETPTLKTLIGAGIILLTLMVHGYFVLKAPKSRT